MRGTIWTTFGWSQLRDKVLQLGAQFGPHLVKVRSETKSFNKGHHFFATFGQCWLRNKFFWWPIMASFSGYIWLKSPAWHVLQQGAFFPFLRKIWQTPVARYATLISHHSFFWMPIAWASQPTLPTRPLFPKRPDITGAPNNNFLDCLIGGIKANTIPAIGTINPGSLCTLFLYAPLIHINLAGELIAFIGNSSNKLGEFSLIKINITSICVFPYIKDKATMDDSVKHGDDLPTECYTNPIGTILKNPLLVLWFPTFSSPTLGKFYPMVTSVVMTKSRQNSCVWALDMNYGSTLPMMPSRNLTASLVSWRKAKLMNPSRSTLTQIGMVSPSHLPHQMAPSVQWP